MERKRGRKMRSKKQWQKGHFLSVFCTFSCDFTTPQRRDCYHSHFTEKEAKAQGD